MRKLSNPSSRRKARQIQGGKASVNPGRFVALTFVIIVSVAAGTTLGATMVRFEFRAPLNAAIEKPPVTPVIAENTTTETKKTVVAVKTRAVNPLRKATDSAAVAALPVGSDRFGGDATQQAFAENKSLVNRLQKKATVDGERTGSILSQPAPAEIAESEDEIIELERKLTAEGAEHFNVPEAADANSAPLPPQQGLRKRRTAKYVNLRAGPDNDADVLAIVPAKTEVLAEDNCVHWCATVYEGQKGYIYKTFFRGTAQLTGG